MRYEKKFPFSESNLELIYARLRSFGFFNAYPRRQVNSIYYDTSEFYLYHISEVGISNRVKKRIRWYGSEDNISIEYKIKSSESGRKEINNFLISEKEYIEVNIIDPFTFSNQIKNIPISLDEIYLPNVGVAYKRIYLISLCKTTRITLDFQIKFSKILKESDTYRIQNWIPSENSILEVKYDSFINNSNLQLNNFIDDFDLQLTRFSKYCQAVSTCY